MVNCRDSSDAQSNAFMGFNALKFFGRLTLREKAVSKRQSFFIAFLQTMADDNEIKILNSIGIRHKNFGEYGNFIKVCETLIHLFFR